MALTRRGRRAAVSVVAGLVVIAIAVLAFGGGGSGNPVRKLADKLTGHTPPPPTTCPLTGQPAPGGAVPQRPALALKVENLPLARPQTGLNTADIVYEEPVEAMITRFVVIYQCHGAPRVEPVRSGRLEDASILRQYDHPLFGYAGAVPSVIAAVHRAGIHDVNFDVAVSAYLRDPARYAPHNLYTSTEALWRFGRQRWGSLPPPPPVFSYSTTVPADAKPAAAVHLPFSGYSNVTWKWSAGKQVWLRYYNGSTPATLSNGQIIDAKNIVVQVVRVTLTSVTDVNGVHSPFAHVIGTGTVYVFRNGKVIQGRWIRNSEGQVTKLVDAQGNEIPLQPGRTWVELFPSTDKVGVKP